MIDKLTDFAEKYLPPVLILVLMVPFWILQIILYWTIYFLIILLVPFAYNELVQCWWRMNWHPDDWERDLAAGTWEDKYQTK